jgi:hypothetical protein
MPTDTSRKPDTYSAHSQGPPGRAKKGLGAGECRDPIGRRASARMQKTNFKKLGESETLRETHVDSSCPLWLGRSHGRCHTQEAR